MTFHHCLSCLLTIFTIQSSETLLSTQYVSDIYEQRYMTEFTHSKMLQSTIKEAQIEMECGKLCGSSEQCLYFFGHVDRLCLVCLTGKYDDEDHLEEWQGGVLPGTKIWLKKDHLYFIGYDASVNEGGVDSAHQHSLVDRTPIPVRSKLVSFMFTAGAVNREIRFGVYRRHSNCIYELVHQWVTSSYHLGQNEYFTNDFIVEKGYHIGFTFTQGGVISTKVDSVQRYCASDDVPIINQQQSLDGDHIGYRRYSFQGKLMLTF